MPTERREEQRARPRGAELTLSTSFRRLGVCCSSTRLRKTHKKAVNTSSALRLRLFPFARSLVEASPLSAASQEISQSIRVIT